MKASNLDRRVTIRRKMLSSSPSGEPVEAWSVIASRRPASMWPVRADERFASPVKTAYEQIEFKVRYSSNLSDLTPQDQVIHPALTVAQEADPDFVVLERTVHDVLGVLEIGRREGLRIITQRRADVIT